MALFSVKEPTSEHLNKDMKKSEANDHETEAWTSRFQINRDMLPSKVAYFTMLFACSAYEPYFFSMGVILFAAGLVEASHENFVDARTLQLIEHTSNGATFGQQRWVGNIGTAIAALLASYLVQST